MTWGKGNLYGQGRQFFACIFWAAREDLSVGKRTNHDMFERIHFWVVFYDINGAMFL